jgi:uncharacterized protein (DUF433 family)
MRFPVDDETKQRTRSKETNVALKYLRRYLGCDAFSVQESRPDPSSQCARNVRAPPVPDRSMSRMSLPKEWGGGSEKRKPRSTRDRTKGIMGMTIMSRITVNPKQCGGRPCIRGMRIRVTDVLDLLASGLSREQVLEELPDLEAEDIEACLRFASRRLDYPVVVA